MSSTIWNSLLLSKGSIFSTTSLKKPRLTEARIATRMPSHSLRRADAPVRGSSSGDMRRRKKRSSLAVVGSTTCPAAPCATGFIIFSASQGVMTKAMASEMNMPIEALIGIGLM